MNTKKLITCWLTKIMLVTLVLGAHPASATDFTQYNSGFNPASCTPVETTSANDAAEIAPIVEGGYTPEMAIEHLTQDRDDLFDLTCYYRMTDPNASNILPSDLLSEIAGMRLVWGNSLVGGDGFFRNTGIKNGKLVLGTHDHPLTEKVPVLAGQKRNLKADCINPIETDARLPMPSIKTAEGKTILRCEDGREVLDRSQCDTVETVVGKKIVKCEDGRIVSDRAECDSVVTVNGEKVPMREGEIHIHIEADSNAAALAALQAQAASLQPQSDDVSDDNVCMPLRKKTAAYLKCVREVYGSGGPQVINQQGKWAGAWQGVLAGDRNNGNSQYNEAPFRNFQPVSYRYQYRSNSWWMYDGRSWTDVGCRSGCCSQTQQSCPATCTKPCGHSGPHDCGDCGPSDTTGGEDHGGGWNGPGDTNGGQTGFSSSTGHNQWMVRPSGN